MFDLAVIGSGFGGSFLAMIARRLGRSVLLLERQTHPRFAIGESSTPLADLLWLDLARRYDLPQLLPFAKWGTWRRAHPEVACGLKRGFTFYHHKPGHPFGAAPDRSDQLLVEASPRDDIADTHWYRPDFDDFLVREAVRLGVEYLDACEVTEVRWEGDQAHLRAQHRSRAVEFRARFVVDAGNVGSVLVRSLGLERSALPHLPGTQAVFSHFRDVARLDALPLHTDIARAPYPVDDAAVHHVFAGGWIWVLRFCNGITSAGVAAVDPVAEATGFADREAGWKRLLQRLPTVAHAFEAARPVHPFVHARRLGFRVAPAAGQGWALLASAAGFVDPLLSSGFALTLLGIERLGEFLDRAWHQPGAWQARLAEHARQTDWELRAIEEYVSALYARMGDFAAFTEVARLYFCAVIHAETARRLGDPHRGGGYLMAAHPVFGPAAREICAAARAAMPAAELARRVEPLLEAFDLGGLDDPARRPWYPVRAKDLRSRRTRIGATADEIDQVLRTAGLEE